jgi:hypothetical protein
VIRNEQGQYIEAPFHAWFSLSYSSYFVIPRLALEAMPADWQENLIALMDEAYEKHHLETPSYHVLRDEPEYTLVDKYDSEDDSSRDYVFTAVREDPWANYRRGSVEELCPTFTFSAPTSVGAA